MDLRIDTPPETRPWIERLARLGYAAKGVVYVLVGWLAADAARGLGELPSGSEDVFGAVLDQPFGRVLLAVIALGLVGYTLWRIVAAVADPERKGSDAKGLAVRAYYLGSAVVHGALAAGAVRVLMDGGGRTRVGTGDEMPTHTATLMAQPFGRWLVGGVGIAFLAAAVHHGRLALGRYRKKLKPYRLPEWAQPAVGPVVGFGLMARGLVFAIVGGFLVQAARHARPAEAKGLAGALGTLLAPPAGPWLLGLVAAGLAAYGIFNLLMARYRSIRP
jgi:hypothetical protein